MIPRVTKVRGQPHPTRWRNRNLLRVGEKRRDKPTAAKQNRLLLLLAFFFSSSSDNVGVKQQEQRTKENVNNYVRHIKDDLDCCTSKEGATRHSTRSSAAPPTGFHCQAHSDRQAHTDSLSHTQQESHKARTYTVTPRGIHPNPILTTNTTMTKSNQMNMRQTSGMMATLLLLGLSCCPTTAFAPASVQRSAIAAPMHNSPLASQPSLLLRSSQQQQQLQQHHTQSRHHVSAGNRRTGSRTSSSQLFMMQPAVLLSVSALTALMGGFASGGLHAISGTYHRFSISLENKRAPLHRHEQDYWQEHGYPSSSSSSCTHTHTLLTLLH